MGVSDFAIKQLESIELIEFVEARGGIGNRVIARFPIYPNYAQDFIRFIRSNCLFSNHKTMITYCSDNRNQLLGYLNELNIESYPLFNRSIVAFMDYCDFSKLCGGWAV